MPPRAGGTPLTRDRTSPTAESNAAKAQALRSAAYMGMARDQAIARRRRSRRGGGAWAIALLVAAGSITAVFQSCAGSKAARTSTQGEDQPLLHTAKTKPMRTAKGKPGAEEESGPPSKTAFDHAATDLQAMFDQMGDQPEAPASQPATPPAPAAAGPGRKGTTSRDREPNLPPATDAAPQPEQPVTPTPAAPITVPTPEPSPSVDALFGPPLPPPTPPPGESSSTDTLSLGTVALCTRVESFGRFTPFFGNRFLAGRTNAAIVYVEVDHFTQLPAGDAADAHSVELAMSVELFHADGSRQWRSGEAVIRDHSRTRRRDFYLVQRIDLPANLSVGNYTFKVTVRDRLAAGAGGSGGGGGTPETETNLPIQIVADAGLLGGGGDAANPVSSAKPLRNAPFAGPEPLKPLSPLTIIPGASRPLASRPARDEHRNGTP